MRTVGATSLAFPALKNSMYMSIVLCLALLSRPSRFCILFSLSASQPLVQLCLSFASCISACCFRIYARYRAARETVLQVVACLDLLAPSAASDSCARPPQAVGHDGRCVSHATATLWRAVYA